MTRRAFQQHRAILAGLAALGLVAVPRPVAAASSCALSPTRPTVCVGAYAACSQATCSSTSKASDPSPLARCDCPVQVGPALADLAQLPGGRCAAPPGTVFSLFATDESVGKGVMSCAGGAFAQCWNASCSWKAGDKVARCACPLCAGTFLTSGGGCDAGHCVGQLLVGAPFEISGSTCKP
jgi:hypothetical protein